MFKLEDRSILALKPTKWSNILNNKKTFKKLEHIGYFAVYYFLMMLSVERTRLFFEHGHDLRKFEISRVHVPIAHQDVKEVLPRVFEGLGAPPLWRAVSRVADAAVGRASPPSAHPR